MEDNHLGLVVDIVSAYVGNNPVPRDGLPGLIADVSAALARFGQAAPEPENKPVPAVNPKRSVFPDYILSLEDGKQYRTLKRHLSKRGLTPAEYREKWGLPASYPMVAESYAAKRSQLAKSLGLGRKPQASAEPAAPAEQPEAAPEAAPKPRRGRKKAAAE